MEIENFILFGIALVILLIIALLLALIGFTIETTDLSFKIEMINPIERQPNISLLEELLRKEIINKKKDGWACIDYSKYYNKTLSEKYPRLDIRFPRYVDICNNLTMCDNYHTFLIVAGYGSECILDQTHIACITIKDTNKTIKELDKLKW